MLLTIPFRTLPKRQIANGMAEVIKSFAIRNEEMFGVLEECYDKVFDPVANYGKPPSLLTPRIIANARNRYYARDYCGMCEDQSEGGYRG